MSRIRPPRIEPPRWVREYYRLEPFWWPGAIASFFIDAALLAIAVAAVKAVLP